jgi:signal recognition particle receptor subunit beta
VSAFRVGIRLVDERLRLGAGPFRALFISSPGIDPAPYGVNAAVAALREGLHVTYLVNNKPADAIRAIADIMGWDLEEWESTGQLDILDSFTAYMNIPSNEAHKVDAPQDVRSLLGRVCELAPKEGVVVFDSLSSYIDMCEGGEGEGVARLMAIIDEVCEGRHLVGLFSTWGYEPDHIARLRGRFDTVLALKPVERLTIVRQFLRAEKIDGKATSDLVVPIKVMRPGGVRVFFPKILVTGPFHSGKSSIVHAISTSYVSVDRMGTTIAMDHGYLDYKGFAADIYGTPGQEVFDPILEFLAEEALAVVLVVDATKPDTFPRARRMLQLTKGYALPMVVAANFTDLPEAMDPDEVREGLGLPPDVPVVPTIAVRTGWVEELLEALFGLLMKGERLSQLETDTALTEEEDHAEDAS